MQFFLSTFEQTLLFLPLALGLYLSYALLKATDMTVDGSFVLGAAIFARLTSHGFSPWIGVALALVGGALAGLGTGLIQRGGKVSSLLAGILMVFILYSVNFQVLGRPNISLLSFDLQLSSLSGVVLWSLIAAVAVTLFYFTEKGLRLRAFGVNSTLLSRLGYSLEFYRCFGPMLANMLAAYCGVMTAQMNGYADINMGQGMALTGIGSVVIGEILCAPLLKHRPFHPLGGLLICLVGVFCYFLFVNLFLHLGIDPLNLKLALGLVLVLFLRMARGA